MIWVRGLRVAGLGTKLHVVMALVHDLPMREVQELLVPKPQKP